MQEFCKTMWDDKEAKEKNECNTIEMVSKETFQLIEQYINAKSMSEEKYVWRIVCT